MPKRFRKFVEENFEMDTELEVCDPVDWKEDPEVSIFFSLTKLSCFCCCWKAQTSLFKFPSKSSGLNFHFTAACKRNYWDLSSIEDKKTSNWFIVDKTFVENNFLKMGHSQSLFVYFRSSQTLNRLKTVDLSRNRTRIVRVESEHADHLTTTTSLFFTLEIVWTEE